jgi:hypothetical protein
MNENLIYLDNNATIYLNLMAPDKLIPAVYSLLAIGLSSLNCVYDHIVQSIILYISACTR